MLFKGGNGSGQRLLTRDFLVLGLITFWVYTALRLAAALNAHFARRWSELQAREQLRSTDPRLAALRATGFTVPRAVPWAAAALFASSAVFTLMRLPVAAAALFTDFSNFSFYKKDIFVSFKFVVKVFIFSAGSSQIYIVNVNLCFGVLFPQVGGMF